MARTWVIGGKQGIGQAITQGLEEQGGPVLPTDKEVDVTSTMQLRDAYSDFRPDYIVYCAGINHLMPAATFDEFEALDILDINVLGFMRVIHLVAANQDMHKVRSIVAISSDAATHPMRNSMAYCASKAALNMAVRCAARELAPHVRVNAIAPGPVADTAMSAAVDRQVLEIKGWTHKNLEKDVAAGIPMGRRAMKSEIAEVVSRVLLFPQFATGMIIEVNGGR